MQKLNLPSFKYRLKSRENKALIFDLIRKKFVVLQPEEWVRQHCIHYLINELEVPQSLINVEKSMTVAGNKKRYDIIVFYPDGRIFLVVECKSPKVKIDQSTFDQIARYNLSLKSDYLMVTNGMEHYFCTMDYEVETYHFLSALPNFKQARKNED